MRCLGSPRRPACWLPIVVFLFIISASALAQVSLTGTPVNFGNVQIANSLTKAIAVTNTGSSKVKIYKIAVSGTGFSFVGPALPVYIGAQQTVYFSLSFAPQTAGTFTGSATAYGYLPWGRYRTTRYGSVTVALSGTGYTSNPGYLSAPSSMNLGSVQVGSSQTQAMTLSNTGASSVTISSAAVSGTAFSVSGLSFPYTLAAGTSTSMSVKFSPTAAGTSNGTLSLSSNASNTSVGVSLTGSGYTSGYLSAPSSMNLGSVQVGSSQTQAMTLSNTGGSSVTISSAAVSGTTFSVSGLTFPYTLAAGASASLSVKFSPTASGTSNATLSVSSNASDSSAAVSLTGSGYTSGYLSAPSSMNLGSVQVGSSQTQAMTLSNTGGSSITISSGAVSGTAFSVSGLSFPYTLAAGASTSMSVKFSPTVAGTSNATLSLSSNASDSSVAVSLTGSGTTVSGTLGVTPASMSFGTVTVGSSGVQNGSVTASGGSVTVSSASSSNALFTISGLTLPVTLAAGQSAPFSVTFAPTAAGSASSNLSFFTSNSTSATETASGSGATLQHTVNLSWNASSSTSVSGYNVYRGTAASGPFSKINSALNPSMSYSDSTVQSGKTYYYVTTSVDSSGAESSYSNQATAVVPMP